MVAGTDVATIGVGTILVASTDVQCTLVNIFKNNALNIVNNSESMN